MENCIVERMKRGEKISIGMVHTQALPGALRNTMDIRKITELAVADAKNLEAAGFDAVIVENVNDAPYGKDPMNRQKVAAMTRICTEVRRAVSVPVGIDACGDQLAGFDIGSMTGISFLRLSNLVDVRVTSRGITTPCGGEAVAHRRRIGAEHIRIFADIHLKHTYPVFPEVTLETSARWAAAAGADVIIVTGAETGGETSLEDLRRVKAAVSIPVVAGSGVDARNVQEQYAVCDGAIIGSALKRDKKLSNPIDLQLAEAFVKAAEGHQR